MARQNVFFFTIVCLQTVVIFVLFQECKSRHQSPKRSKAPAARAAAKEEVNNERESSSAPNKRDSFTNTMSGNNSEPPENDDVPPSASAPDPAPPAPAPREAARTLHTSMSFRSVHSTTRIVHSGSSLSIHSTSTHSSVEIIGTGATPPDEEILSIQTSLEQVAASQSNPYATRTRAGFNSISDALGNLRVRLHQAAASHHEIRRHSSSTSSSHHRSSWIHRLQERLHILDAAHSSRTPVQVMESRQRRRRSIPNNAMLDQQADEGFPDNTEENATEETLPPLCVSAAIFHIDISPRHDNTPADDQSGMDGRPSVHHLRTSVLFASRTVANRSITDGTSNLLLASGGDRVSTGRRDLLGDRILRNSGSLRDFDLHVHPSVPRLLSPIADTMDASSATIRSEAISSSTTMEEDDEDVMEVEPTTPNDNVEINNKLYSWGWGDQSLHDDSVDRVLSMDQDGKKTSTATAELMEVSSRLQSKSIVAVATGHHHSACATSQGGLYIVGKNLHGCVDPNLPEGQIISRPVLLDCISHVRVLQVSCGYDHTAVLSSNGSVITWGSNSHGQLGHRVNANQIVQSADTKGPTNCRPMGMALGKGRRASAISCGTNYTFVLTQHMALLACGVSSICGHRDDSCWGMPQEIPSLVGLPIVTMSAGDGHAAVVTAHGTAYIWGENRSGCCARDFPTVLTSPVPVKFSPQTESNGAMDDIEITHAACGCDHTVFVNRSGQLLVCGSNYRGQLGIAASKLHSTSTIVTVHHPQEGSFVSAAAGNGHSLVLDAAGDLWATNANGLQCILEGNPVLAMAAGGDRNCIAVASSTGRLKSLQRTFSIEAIDETTSILDAVDNLLDNIESGEMTREHTGQEIANKSEELLRHPTVLNLIQSPTKLESMFERMFASGDATTRQIISSSIERGIKCGLESLRGSRMIYPEAVVCMLNYIKFFDLRRDESIVFDQRGEVMILFCDTMLGLPFEGYNALHDFAVNLYPRKLFVSMLVRPLLLALNACTKFTVDENDVVHTEPSRRAVPVIVAVLSWFYAMAEEAGLADATDFYSDGVSRINVETLFEDLCRMKKASPHEKSRNFYLCAHPFLLSPGCKRNLLQMESQVEMFKAMMGDVNFNPSTNEFKVEPFYCLEIEREHLVQQTLSKIKEANPKDIRKRLRVSFKGEEGLDAGGVTKEFFQLLSEDLFDVHSGLWSKKYGDEINWFNPDNTWDENAYELVGVLFGLALYNSVLLDVRFPLAVYRKILGLPLGLEDIIDEELRRGLKHLLDYEGNDVEDVFCLTFELTWMELGEERRLELKPEGANIPVTSENREEYVLRYVRWVLVDSIESQWNSFQTGVMRVMEDSSLDLFLPEELELLVVGSPDLDFTALEENTKYEGGYDKDSEVVKNFWKFVHDAPPEEQKQLLKFVTASSKAPIGGLGKLSFTIQRAGPDSFNLPTSHTCFNTLLLPDYGSDYEKLKNLLGRAVMECEGFGLE